MTMEAAKKAVSDSVYQVRLTQVGFGRGAGGRELALAATKLEEAEHWLEAAEKAREKERADAEPDRRGVVDLGDGHERVEHGLGCTIRPKST